MKNQPTIAFKAKDTSKLEEFNAERERRWAEYQAKTSALTEKLGKTLMVRRGFHGIEVTGYAAKQRNEEPLPGFRRDARTGTMKPRLNTKIGKAVGAEIDEAKYSSPTPPGLAEMLLRGNYMAYFRVQKFGDDWYATLTVDVSDEPLEPMWTNERGNRVGDIDLHLWEEVKLSEWHRRAEASEGND